MQEWNLVSINYDMFTHESERIFATVSSTFEGILKVTVSETLLLQTNNGKRHLLHRIAPFRITSNYLQGYSPGLFKCNSLNVCAAFNKISTDIVRRAVHLQQLSYLFNLPDGLSMTSPPLPII